MLADEQCMTDVPLRTSAFFAGHKPLPDKGSSGAAASASLTP